MLEIWKDIEGFENKYQISNFGRVKSINKIGIAHNKFVKKKDKILKYQIRKDPIRKQPLVALTDKEGKIKWKEVCRLVAQAFIKNNLNRDDYVLVKDGDLLNCKIDNLIVVNRSDFAGEHSSTKPYKYEYFGNEITIREFAKMKNLSVKTVKSRIYDLNWSIYECDIPIEVGKRKKGVNC